MIKLSFANVITIALAGALGYALLAGFSKLQGAITTGSGPLANGTGQ